MICQNISGWLLGREVAYCPEKEVRGCISVRAAEAMFDRGAATTWASMNWATILAVTRGK